MPTLLYADVHVPGPVIAQLRLRDVDILAATELDHQRKTDEELLIISSSMGRVMITQDIRFRVMAEDWISIERPFAGLIFAHQKRVSFGDLVGDLELIAKATNPDYWTNRVLKLPL